MELGLQALERCRAVAKHLTEEEENLEERIEEEKDRLHEEWKDTVVELEAELRRLRRCR